MRGWNSINSLEKLKAKGMVVQDFTHLPKNRAINIEGNNLVKENTELLKKVKRNNRHEESDLQINCVETFRLMYPKYRWKLFAIPNGNYRTAIGAEILKREGVLPGVCDIFLAVPKSDLKNRIIIGGLFIEFKTNTGRLSEYQVNFIKEVGNDYRCIVIRTVEDFIKEVKNYLEL